MQSVRNSTFSLVRLVLVLRLILDNFDDLRFSLLVSSHSWNLADRGPLDQLTSRLFGFVFRSWRLLTEDVAIHK